MDGAPTQVLAYGAAGTGKTSVLGMRRVFAGSLFSTAVQTMWRELAALQATSRVSVEVLNIMDLTLTMYHASGFDPESCPHASWLRQPSL